MRLSVSLRYVSRYVLRQSVAGLLKSLAESLGFCLCACRAFHIRKKGDESGVQSGVFCESNKIPTPSYPVQGRAFHAPTHAHKETLAQGNESFIRG